MNNLDFSKIRMHEDSQNSAFEELICQLARLSRPENAKSFIRKEGSGGDAGVECFWKLKDGSEHAWQAKYFKNKKTIESKQWKQISDSVETALNKHPNLKKYYICLPLNRTNQRQGKKKSQLDKWNEYVLKWTEIANSKKMNVEFVFWGKSEIVNMLSTDDPHFSGRSLYWFNEPILQVQHLKNIAEKAKESLGDRFSPEFNIELPIAKSFDGVGFTPNWMNDFCSFANSWFEKLNDLKALFDGEDNNEITDRWKTIEGKLTELESLLRQTIKEKSLYRNRVLLRNVIEELMENTHWRISHTETEEVRKIQWYFNRVNDATYDLARFFRSKNMTAFSIKSMLISGDAGVGKSHLLCDIALNRLEDNLPTLFLLGQHYEGGNPLNFISDSLDLNSNSYKEILGALDALGEAYSTRTLIIIDAINEGPHKEEWQNHIERLIVELRNYPYIAFVFSCRSTYLQYLLPQINNSEKKQSEVNLTVEIEHEGFPDSSTIYKYLEKQNIFVPSSPIMDPEFFNPLFLKICCKSLKARGESRFPIGSQGIIEAFTAYIDAISETIYRNKKYRIGEKVVLNTLQLFALRLFPDNLHGLPIDQARELIKSSDPKSETGDLLDELLNEGVLSEDIYKDGPIIRFTYERLSDYFIVYGLISKYIISQPKNFENLKSCFKKGTPIGDIFFSNKPAFLYGGIVETLSVCIAEKFNCELFDLVELKENLTKEQMNNLIELLFEKVFINSILSRSPKSFTERTFELLESLLNHIPKYSFFSYGINILLQLSIQPKHPWNAELLHKILFNKALAERDQLWSIHVAASYENEENLTIANLIDWPCSANLNNLEPECAKLYAIVLIWFTATSHRVIRDRATKSAVIILTKYPEHLLPLMDTFTGVNDLYVLERLYAIVYGVTVNISDKKLISKIAEKTYQKIFSTGEPIPHILLRDYARCILEFAYNQRLLTNEINLESFRPPYKSDWPIGNPMQSEIDALVDTTQVRSVHYSLMGFTGDFGIYTMNCVHSFSPTLLTKEHPETGKELQRKFIDKLSDEKKSFHRKLSEKYKLMKKQKEKEINSLKEGFKNEFGKEFDEEYLDMVRVDRKHNQYDKYLKQYNDLKEKCREQLSEEKSKFMKTLNEEQREYERWLFDDRFMGNRPAAFSRKWAKRWVCKHVYKMGWKKELFEEFEKSMCSIGRGSEKVIERIGKKYQWIALHKLLAHLADNVHYIRGYDDKNKYEGPWQLLKRDIDPTCYLRKIKSDPYFGKNTTQCWWYPHVFNLPKEDIEQQEEWLKSTSVIPSFKDLLQVKNINDNNFWTVLHGSVNQEEEISHDKKEELYRPVCWFTISAIIVHKKDYDLLHKELKK